MYEWDYSRTEANSRFNYKPFLLKLAHYWKEVNELDTFSTVDKS